MFSIFFIKDEQKSFLYCFLKVSSTKMINNTLRLWYVNIVMKVDCWRGIYVGKKRTERNALEGKRKTKKVQKIAPKKFFQESSKLDWRRRKNFLSRSFCLVLPNTSKQALP